jgi:hypothetical protein
MQQVSELFQQAAFALACKRTMLRGSHDAIATLVVGSSHGDFGFDPGCCPGAFNLCARSQDFRHSDAIYRRVSRALPRLRNLVVFYSVFSPGHVLERSPEERDIALAMHEILDLDVGYTEPALASRAGTLKGELAEWRPQAEGRLGFLPHLQKSFFPNDYGAQRRAQDHLKLNRNNEALLYLAATAVRAQRMGHRLLVVIPPARSDYRRECDAADAALFRGLDLIRTDLEIAAFDLLNLWNDPAFDDHHFGDYDHLNPLGDGVAVLSTKVSKALGG